MTEAENKELGDKTQKVWAQLADEIEQFMAESHPTGEGELDHAAVVKRCEELSEKYGIHSMFLEELFGLYAVVRVSISGKLDDIIAQEVSKAMLDMHVDGNATQH